MTFKVLMKTTVFNIVEVVAETKEDAMDLASELAGEIDLYEGNVDETYPVRVLTQSE